MIPPKRIYIVKGRLERKVSSHKYEAGERKIYLFKDDGEPFCPYPYNRENVHILLHTDKRQGVFRVRDNANETYKIAETIHIYKDESICYFGLEHSYGNTIDYLLANDCSIETPVTDSDKSVFSYLYEISKLSKIGDDSENQISLSQKYERIKKYIFDGSLFAKYLHPDQYRPKQARKAPFLVFPFGCNAGQWEATKNAVSCEVSIIQGPPGTGKTQTILNIIANLILQGKTVEVVSNNNSAVENVLEKLQKYEMAFFVALLGRSENKEKFFRSQECETLDLSKWKRTPDRQFFLKKNIGDISSSLPEYFNKLEKKATLENIIAEYELQLKGAKVHTWNRSTRRHHIASSKLYRLIISIDENILKRGKPSIFNRLSLLFYGFGSSFDRESLETAARMNALSEKKREYDAIEKWCAVFSPQYDQYVAFSEEYIQAKLFERFGKNAKRTIFSKEDLWKDASAFLKQYPVVLSSTFSATSNIHPAIPFDVIIMDEASQIDVSAGALAINCAKSAVIVGDDKQLPNVVTKNDREQADRIMGQYRVPDSYSFVANSFLTSIQKVFPDAPVTLLREHYRCEPRIIGFCNRQFYDGQLITMTKRSDDPSMKVISTVPGNHARDRRNIRQAEECIEEIKRLRKMSFLEIGVIVPYNEQAKCISELLARNELNTIPVSTVHKFQGREMDAIILSTVDNYISEFVDDPHLLNVAISRAKKHFTLIINQEQQRDSNIRDLIDYISYYGGVIQSGQIRSVFDLLYRQYAEERARFLEKHKYDLHSEYLSEMILTDKLNNILSEPNQKHLRFIPQYRLRDLIHENMHLSDEERKYAYNDWTRVDFLVYNKTTRRPVLVIEVDGIAFHREGTRQAERDQMKNHILELANIPLLRLPTDGSREEEKILSALSKAG